MRACGNQIGNGAAGITTGDHTLAYETGGKTCLCNLAPLCRRHHQVKQTPGWTLEQTTPGTLTWTTPSGRRYTTSPTSYPE